MKHSAVAWIPAVLLSGCMFPTHWVEETRSFEIDPATVDKLRCSTHNGSINSAVDADVPQVSVIAQVRGGGTSDEDAKRALAQIDVSCASVDQELVIGWKWKTEPEGGWGAEVSFEVTLPRAVPTEASTHNGAIRVVASGVCRAESHNGGVVLSGEMTDATAFTHNGAIAINGPVERFEAVSHNGGVVVSRIADGKLDGRIETHNGAVLIELSPGADVQVECSTDNGALRVSQSLSGLRIDDDRIEGKLGAGTGRLQVGTHNGDIEIRGPRAD